MANYDASSTNKSKKSVRTYKDLNLDFARHPVTNDLVKIEDVDAIKRSVRNLINTNFYERPFHAELGCGVRDLLFENYTPLTGIFIKRKIQQLLINFEPRARLVGVTSIPNLDRNLYEVSIEFYVINAPAELVDLSFTLERLR